MSIPKGQLVSELERRRESKLSEQWELDARYGPQRIRLTSYMENIGWPGLFGYDMRRVHGEPGFAIEQGLRERIFWADNVHDDTVPTTAFTPDVGHNWHMTLFGQEIRHTPIGVPEFDAHSLRDGLDLGALGRFDFQRSGVMPRLIDMYRGTRERAADEYGGKLDVTFPFFQSGPLDIYVQLRGYEGFVTDTREKPDGLRDALSFLARERLRFAEERRQFLAEEALPGASFVSDDWLNVPFISPVIFRDFVVPAYALIQAGEGPVTGFHTCGNIEAVAPDLLRVFPGMRVLEVSGWNDVGNLDAVVDPAVEFAAAIINTVSLGSSPDEQRGKLAPIVETARRRRVSVCAQAIQRLYATYEETLFRLNAFLSLARTMLYDGARAPTWIPTSMEET
jgi:hypothetical protein